jgi:hypothetical protein
MPLLHPSLAGDTRLEAAAAGGPSVKPLPFTEPQGAVRRIQLALHRLSYVFFESFSDGEPDGLFGPDTLSAVINFQRAEFWNQPGQWDGRVGRNTLARLDAALLAYSMSEAGVGSRDLLMPVRGPSKGPTLPVKPRPKGGPSPRPGPQVEGAKRIWVNTDRQILEALLGNKRCIYRFDCVTGDSGHPTDPGFHKVINKLHPCRSTTYNVQMNYAQFFTSDGKAIHQYHGIVPLAVIRVAKSGSDWFGSHGCVRLVESDARTLYAWTPEMGTTVEVVPAKKT